MKRFSTFLSWLIILVFIGQLGMPAPIVRADEGTGSVPPLVDGWVQLSTAEQLEYINQNQELYLTQNIKLMNNIDLSGYDWIPFGGNGYPSFSGTFDGRGYLISGIKVNDNTLEVVGFLGESSGIIKNLGVAVDIEGGAYTGGLVGSQSGGSIDYSFSTGSVTGGNHGNDTSVSATGGLAGSSRNSTISYSYSTAYVISGTSANMYAGGLVGSQGAGAIHNSYATGAVSNLASGNPYTFTAGLMAFMVYGTVENSYATGEVSVPNANGSNTNIAGFAGFLFADATVRNSFFDTTTTRQSIGIGFSSSENEAEATGYSTDFMIQQSTYTDWDFTHTWAIHSDVNHGYPYLQPVILTDELPRASKGVPYSLPLAAFDGAARGLIWSASGLPEGMSLSSSGLLEGIPAQSGAFSITITVTDAGDATASTNLQLVVDEGAPDLNGYSISSGSVIGSTKVTAVPVQQGHTFAYRLGHSETVQPLIGDPLPSGAIPYEIGSDIRNVIAGQYLDIYEVDADLLIQAWSSVRLETTHIQSAVPVTGVRLDQANLTLVEGGSPQKLTAVVEPEDATNKTVTWSSSNSTVAAVDQTGKVTPIAAGTTIITVTTTDGSYAASATVTVLRGSTAGETGTGTGTDHPIPQTANKPSNKVMIKINGKNVEVTAVKEKAEDGRSVTRLLLNAAYLSSIYASNEEVVIDINNTDPVIQVDLPAGAVQDALASQPDSILEIRVNRASYRLPLNIWKNALDESVITVEIAEAPDAYNSDLKADLTNRGYRMLAAPVEFAHYVDGHEITDVREVYTKRTITLDSTVNPATSTVVWVDANNRLYFVPSVFQTGNNETIAVFYAPHNSLYTVVESSRKFTDLQGHWAQDDIQLLAGKLVVHGVTGDTFAPDRQVTRAEFAAMLVRSLGIAEQSASLSFADVQPDAWYARAVEAAHEAGLITGYGNGMFRPNEPITHEQIASMIARALKFAGKSQADIIEGYTETTFIAKDLATRAQSAVIFKRMLQYLHFID